MKRFFTVLFSALALVFAGGVIAAPVANAAPSSISIEAAPAVAVQKADVTKLIGSGGIKPAYSLNFCYIAMDWHRWCYQTNCTYFETVALGCRNNTWVRTTTYWWA